MRYLWDQKDEYIAGVSHIPGAKLAIELASPRLRRWDVSSASRVDRFVCNSTFVAERVKRHYGRESVVIHPPIEGDSAQRPIDKPGGYLLAAGALVSYKRFDLAIQACEAIGKRLIVAGSGPAEAKLRAMAVHTEFVIAPDDKTFRDLLAGAEALLFPGVEDFGMIAVESMACGTPVIAYAMGGAMDFIREGETGEFFREPTVKSLTDCIAKFRFEDYEVDKLRTFANGFRREVFLEKIRVEIAVLMQGGESK